MFLSDASVKRPVAMSCLIIALSLLGLNAWRKMGVELMPAVDTPYITVVTVYPGASPTQIEIDVAKRIEDQVVTIDGLKHVSSSCMENVCQTLLEFELGVNADLAATDVREKIGLIISEFPDGVEDPRILKFDVNAKPIANLALTGSVPLDALFDYADNQLRDQLTVISGVADVELVGGAEREVHVLLAREQLAAKGLTSAQVVQAIQQGVRMIPVGRLQEQGNEYVVKFDADFQQLADIESLEIANDQGQRCRIGDVGRVVMSTEELRQKATVDGRPCISIKIVKKSDANAVKVVDRVRMAVQTLNQRLPGGMDLVWVNDDGALIEATVSSAWINIGQGILLTAGILFFFLYNIRSTIVVALTMPLNIIIGLFFMQFLGYTLNTSTLLAIGLTVGILTTDSIVVLEAIVKHLPRTGNVKEAVRLGAREEAVAVLASIGTNVVVLFPIAMMGSLVGRFFRPLAVTMLIMSVVSLFVAFTVIPILCLVFLKAEDKKAGLLAWMQSRWDRGFEASRQGYGNFLRFFERRRWAALLFMTVVVGLLLHAFSLGEKVGFGAFPEVDQGLITVKLEYPTEYSLDKTAAQVLMIEDKLKDLPELKHRLTSIGRVSGIFGQSSEGVYLAEILLRFSERTARDLRQDDLLALVRQRLQDVSECIVTILLPDIAGQQSTEIEMEIAGDDLATLDRLALQCQDLAESMAVLEEPDTTVRIGKPELKVLPNRAILADMGLPATALGMALRTNLEGSAAGTFKQNARNYDIVVQLEDQPGQAQIPDTLLPGTDGHPLVLAGLSHIEKTRSAIQVTRMDKRRISKLLANIQGNVPLGKAVDSLSRQIDEHVPMPPGYDYRFTGMYEIMADAQNAFGEAGLMALVLVILTLSAILESFKQPWLILVTIPLALIGVIWALLLTGHSFSLFVILGIVMMIGIIVNNAILIMDQFNVHVREGNSRHQAMIVAATERLRPVIMITLAAVLGMLPMAMGRGIGAELRNEVGVASVGGILISGVLTLFVMPILYDLFTRKNGAKTKD